jgi:hypothetical protein
VEGDVALRFVSDLEDERAALLAGGLTSSKATSEWLGMVAVALKLLPLSSGVRLTHSGLTVVPSRWRRPGGHVSRLLG